MKMKSLTLLMAIVLSVFGCSKNEPMNDNAQRAPSSTEEVKPVNKAGNIYLSPANNPADRCRDSYEGITC